MTSIKEFESSYELYDPAERTADLRKELEMINEEIAKINQRTDERSAYTTHSTPLVIRETPRRSDSGIQTSIQSPGYVPSPILKSSNIGVGAKSKVTFDDTFRDKISVSDDGRNDDIDKYVTRRRLHQIPIDKQVKSENFGIQNVFPDDKKDVTLETKDVNPFESSMVFKPKGQIKPATYDGKGHG